MKLILLICLSLSSFTFAQSIVNVDKNTGHFTQDGKVLLFHGLNAVYKVPPYHPTFNSTFDAALSFNDEDISNLKRWGFNVIRLGVMWPGVETSKDSYDFTYLAKMRDLVDRLGENGIFTIIDFHQDLLSRFTCGEGVPDYAFSYINKSSSAFPKPLHFEMRRDSHGYPLIDDCLKVKNFAELYFADQTGAMFQCLYDNCGNLQSSFILFWELVAEHFVDSPHVLGYELINEPWSGDLYHHPQCLVPGWADKHHLFPMYTRLHNAIRKIDNVHNIFFEQALTDAPFPTTGFTEGPGGDNYRDRNVLSYHVYCGGTNSTSGVPKNVAVCDDENLYMFEKDVHAAKKLGVGMMMTEFGAMGQAIKTEDAIHYLLNIADKHFQSWSWWQYKYFNDITTASSAAESLYDSDGQLQKEKLNALMRPYPKSTSGVPLSLHFEPSTATLTYSYRPTATADNKTVLFIGDAHYPHGYILAPTPAACVAVAEEGPEAHVAFHPSADCGFGTTIVHVTVAPK